LWNASNKLEYNSPLTQTQKKTGGWSSLFFHNPKILFGNGRNKKPYIPRQFGLTEKAFTLSIGQLFVNIRPIKAERT
jgi:hypothetical protein